MIDTIFFDLGGVLLSKGWDHEDRKQASIEFALDDKFEERHQKVLDAFERGALTLENYLREVVFCMPRDFTPERFKTFMLERSSAKPESLKIVEQLAKSHRFVMTTLNNESRELNDYRIQHFNLTQYFSTFFSSCYLHERKPNAAIYVMALAMTQRRPSDCLFIDDTADNITTANALGLDTIHFESAPQLARALTQKGLL